MMIHVFNAHRVMSTNQPNVLGIRIPLRTAWNLAALTDLLKNYHDQFLLQLLTFGFPIARNYHAPPPCPNYINHAGAINHKQHIEAYIQKEIALQATIGPFSLPPFLGNIGISPLSTPEKKGCTDRRVIMDLSFPPGRSVNDLIDKTIYMGQHIKLTYPTIDALAERVASIGQGALLWKRDLKRAFRQIPVCPGDYSLLGWRWQNQLYFDIKMPMGLTSAAYCCQRITNAIAHIMEQAGFFVVNYLDDFGSAEPTHLAAQSFDHLSQIFQVIGVQEAPEKASPPSTIMTFLGIQINTESMTLQVDPEKLTEISKLLAFWLNQVVFTRKDLERLVGKLQFKAVCVRGARVFTARLFNILRGLPDSEYFYITDEMFADLRWWKTFMRTYDGVSILWLKNIRPEEELFATDASLTAQAAVFEQQAFFIPTPHHIAELKNIAHLELFAVLIALKMWAKQLTGLYITIFCDNQSAVHCINSGKAHDSKMQHLLRCITYVTCTHQMVVRCKYIPSRLNTLPDLLSRSIQDRQAMQEALHTCLRENITIVEVPDNIVNIECQW